ncbi:MAG: stage II sporulation protein M [Acidimicrobiales bacterium]
MLINNIQVSFIAFAAGIFACIGTAAVLIFNGVNIGLAGGLFHSIGEPAKFWGLILPHGLLELSAVVVAGAAGLRMGWSIIAPGDRTRMAALADEGRRSVVIALGLVLAFVVAGLIEGFVTPSGLPTALRIAIGALALAVPVVAVVTRGRAGAAAGWTGQLGEREPVRP